MPGIIDGKGWVEQRIRRLRSALGSGELTESQRVLVETELAQLEEEAARHRRTFRRWLLLGGRRQP